MQTGDTLTDFQFRNEGTDDKLIIKPGRARIGINESACSTYCSYMEVNLHWDYTAVAAATNATPFAASTIEIAITASATTLLAGAAMSLLALSAF